MISASIEKRWHKDHAWVYFDSPLYPQSLACVVHTEDVQI